MQVPVIIGAVVIIALVKVNSAGSSTAAPATPPRAGVSTQSVVSPEDQARKSFEAERTARGWYLTTLIRKSAFDEDALKTKSPKYYKNGVCVEANGKNRFGAYVGWQEYCYLYENNTWVYSGPN
jgi:hypothetical protein